MYKFKVNQKLYYITVKSPFSLKREYIVEEFFVLSMHVLEPEKINRYIGKIPSWPYKQWIEEQELFETKEEAEKELCKLNTNISTSMK